MVAPDLADLVRPEALGPALASATDDDRWRTFTWELVTGGKSNLTFFLRSTAGELVLRRPPSGDLLPRAHDMLREARVQTALAESDVPVPAIVVSDEGDVLGLPCYVMERVPGDVVRDTLPDTYASTASRVALGHGLVETLARIHTTDPATVGLGDFGRPDGFVERQVRLWTGQWQRSMTHEVPEMTELGRRLAARVPAQQRSSIVHGDYKLDNVVLHPHEPGRITAVLDWEMSTLGDPLTDLGLLMLYWRGTDDLPLTLIPPLSHLAGMPTRGDLLGWYAEQSDLDLSDLDFYQAFAHFKFAAVAQGVQARGRSGSAAGQHFGDLDAEIVGLATRGLEHL